MTARPRVGGIRIGETCKRGHSTELYRVRNKQGASYCRICVNDQARARRGYGERVRRLPARERILRSTDRSGDCWIWLRSIDRGGYGYLIIEGRFWIAHRLSYETFVGPIPDGLQVDHLCRVTACVNPEHLEPVTALENTRRKPAAAVCKRGHDRSTFDRWSGGQRHCLACRREDYQRKKAAAEPSVRAKVYPQQRQSR